MNRFIVLITALLVAVLACGGPTATPTLPPPQITVVTATPEPTPQPKAEMSAAHSAIVINAQRDGQTFTGEIQLGTTRPVTVNVGFAQSVLKEYGVGLNVLLVDSLPEPGFSISGRFVNIGIDDAFRATMLYVQIPCAYKNMRDQANVPATTLPDRPVATPISRELPPQIPVDAMNTCDFDAAMSAILSQPDHNYGQGMQMLADLRINALNLTDLPGEALGTQYYAWLNYYYQKGLVGPIIEP